MNSSFASHAKYQAEVTAPSSWRAAYGAYRSMSHRNASSPVCARFYCWEAAARRTIPRFSDVKRFISFHATTKLRMCVHMAPIQKAPYCIISYRILPCYRHLLCVNTRRHRIATHQHVMTTRQHQLGRRVGGPRPQAQENDTCGVRTHAGRPHRLSKPTP